MTQRFRCKLNGNSYGVGDAVYMIELFSDYLKISDMYGREKMTFEVERNYRKEKEVIMDVPLEGKMYILVNEDIKIGKGKLAGQVGHAVASFMYNKVIKKLINRDAIDIDGLEQYMELQKKIILKCPQSKLEELESEGYIAIRDKGLTQLEPNTLTCVNLGIWFDYEAVPQWIKELKLYN